MSGSNFTSTGQCPEPLVTFKNAFRHAYGPVGTILSVVSIIACILNAIVLSRRSMRSATNSILTGIALADLCTATMNLPLLQPPFTQSDPNCPAGFSTTILVYYQLIATRMSLTSHTTSVWFGVLLAGFRFATVSMSSSGTRSSTSSISDIRRARIAMLLTVLFITSLLIPYYIAFFVATPTYEHYLNVTMSNNMNVSLIESKDSRSVLNSCSFTTNSIFYTPAMRHYLTWGLAIQCKVLPCVMMTGFSILLVRMLHVARMKRISVQSCALNNKGGSGAKRSRLNDRLLAYNRTTTMLLCIITLINVIELPNAILLLSRLYSPLAKCLYRNLGELIDFCALLKNAAIFILYCSMSSDFRRTFHQWISCSGSNRSDDRRETSWTKNETANTSRHRLSRFVANNNNNHNIDINQVLEDKSGRQYTEV